MYSRAINWVPQDPDTSCPSNRTSERASGESHSVKEIAIDDRGTLVSIKTTIFSLWEDAISLIHLLNLLPAPRQFRKRQIMDDYVGWLGKGMRSLHFIIFFTSICSIKDPCWLSISNTWNGTPASFYLWKVHFILINLMNHSTFCKMTFLYLWFWNGSSRVVS